MILEGHSHCTRRGLTLVELMASVVVLAVALPPVLSVFAQASKAQVLAELQATSYFLATTKMEEILADRHAATRGFSHLSTSNYPSESPVLGYPGYGRSVTFREVDAVDLTTTDIGSGYLEVTVTVSYAGPGESVVLTGMFVED